MQNEDVEIRLLGSLSIQRGDAVQTLPASRKTRALLAYLVVTGRPQRRDRLCSLFWEVPDDPKGALRWSLSKLRQALGPGENGPLRTDGDTVIIDPARIRTDLAALRAGSKSGWSGLPTAQLQALADGCVEPFCDGLELPRCEEFELWRLAEQENVRQLQRSLLGELVRRLEASPEQAILPARRMVDLDPLDGDMRAMLVRLLMAAGRRGEAEQQRTLAIRQLESDAIPVPASLRISTEVVAEPLLKPEERYTDFQRIRFCTASDGTNIAYSITGAGPPLVKTANWLNHLEFDWESPLFSHWLQTLARQRTLVRYDERGNGLSDWTCAEISFDAFVDDLETVVDRMELDPFDLLGISQGCAVSIAYAVRHPDRVKRLILYGGYATGWAVRGDPAELARRQAMLTLTRQGWGQANPAFRQMFSTLFFPDADPAQTEWFNELQRISTSPESAERLSIAFSQIDVAHLLPKVSVPTLVLHVRDDAVVPFRAGRELASQIPGARFVALEGRNHLLLAQDASWMKVEQAIAAFLDEPV